MSPVGLSTIFELLKILNILKMGRWVGCACRAAIQEAGQGLNDNASTVQVKMKAIRGGISEVYLHVIIVLAKR